MLIKRIDNIFMEDKYNKKIKELFESAEFYDHKNLKKITDYLFKYTSFKDRKSIFAILFAIFIDTGMIKWNSIKKTLNNFDSLVPESSKKFFKGFSSNDSENLSESDKYIEMYINIGRDKKVFPKDLVEFIVSSMKVNPEQIKEIKIHDKFSFFKLPADLSNKAIFLLSVKKFRDKKIVVNYSKQQNK